MNDKIFKFLNLGTARDFASAAASRMDVLLGDDGRFWVVTPAQAQRLERAGYEYA